MYRVQAGSGVGLLWNFLASKLGLFTYSMNVNKFIISGRKNELSSRLKDIVILSGGKKTLKLYFLTQYDICYLRKEEVVQSFLHSLPRVLGSAAVGSAY